MMLLTLAACGGGGDRMPDPDDTSGPFIAWSPRLGGSDLSPVSGAEDEFGPEVAGALARAARAVPNGASQSSLVDGDGRTADEMSVRVVRNDDGNLAHEVTDGARIVVRVPFYNLPRQGLELALFTDLIPGIAPDPSSYPHEVLGMWAWDADGGEVGAFWSRSPSVPPVEFGAASPTGTATYEGDAVGLLAAQGAVTKFVADVELVADFENHTVGGEVEGFRSLAGDSLGDHSVTLGETGFSRQGDPFSGETTAGGVAGSGTWGGRWSGGGWSLGGTFGFAADNGSVGVLGAFTACSCISLGDDPVPLPVPQQAP
jgi:hypothetical protein